MSQRSVASAEYAMKKKRTRREKFRADMERLVPWTRLIAVIGPLSPTSGVGCQSIGVPRMPRMYCLQQWYGLSDVTQAGALLHGDETAAHGDAGYRGVDKRKKAQGLHWHVAMQPDKRRQFRVVRQRA